MSAALVVMLDNRFAVHPDVAGERERAAPGDAVDNGLTVGGANRVHRLVAELGHQFVVDDPADVALVRRTTRRIPCGVGFRRVLEGLAAGLTRRRPGIPAGLYGVDPGGDQAAGGVAPLAGGS